MAKASKSAAKVSKASKASKAPKAPKAASKAPKAAKASEAPKATNTAPATPKPQNANQTTTNPFREGSSYHCIVNAFRSLGVNEWHSFDALLPAIRKEMGSSLKAFAAKEARNEETHKDTNGRLLTNVSVLARKDYGSPLREKCKLEVRWNGREKQAGLFRI